MKTLAVLLLVVMLLPMAGCWDRVELDKLAIVLLLGIDTDPLGDGFEVTVHVLNVAAGPGGQAGSSGDGGGGSSGKSISQTLILSARGQTISDATRNLRGRVQGRFSFHHVRIVLIGEDLARKGIKPVLDLLFRASEIRLTSYLLVCQGSAREKMLLAPEITGTLDEELRGLVEMQGEWSKGYTPRLLEFCSNYADMGVQPVAGKLIKLTYRTPLQPGSSELETKTAIIEGLAVFCDDQLHGWLTATETIGFRYIIGKGGTMTLAVPWHGAKISIELAPESCSFDYIAGSSPPRFRVSLTASGQISEYTGEIKFTPPLLAELEALAADMLGDLLLKTVEKAREMETDFLGYGAVIQRQEPRQWQALNKKWRETLQAVETDIEVRFSLIDTGVTRSPLTR
ncbi:MAG: Ger(x)C family spore germination protein [Eubacteriales bacterium]|nr:Ger(x)C family spore germination protein [Eubacteriales bacterium]